jgi:hypothetical protein
MVYNLLYRELPNPLPCGGIPQILTNLDLPREIFRL